jgi:hypothetical protein
VYQLRDPNTFNQFAHDRVGLSRLLQCDLFDASVGSSERLIVHPGGDLNSVLDRPEGAKYLAIVAGYYSLQKDRSVRLIEFPVIVEKKGLIFRTKVYKLGKLDVELRLGPQQIDRFEVK